MGAGKTTVGRRVAKLLGRPFADTDEMVVRAKGRGISSIFEQESELVFRAAEAHAVVEATGISGSVIACGGGVVLNQTSVEVLRAAGPVVYLYVPAEVAAGRLNPLDERPLLKGHDNLERITQLLSERGQLYERAASHVVEGSGDTEEVALSVLEVLAETSDAAWGPHEES